LVYGEKYEKWYIGKVRELFVSGDFPGGKDSGSSPIKKCGGLNGPRFKALDNEGVPCSGRSLELSG
jgi:hypothetical protein